MSLRPLGVLVCLLLVTADPVHAQETERPSPASRRSHAAAAHPAPSAQTSEDRTLLYQLADAQRALGAQLQALKEQVDALHGELASQQDAGSGLEQEVKAMRDEVKGLYVESSTVKQQIDGLKDDVAGVNSNVSAFRTFSGFFIAVMILLLAVIFVLTIRR